MKYYNTKEACESYLNNCDYEGLKSFPVKFKNEIALLKKYYEEDSDNFKAYQLIRNLWKEKMEG